MHLFRIRLLIAAALAACGEASDPTQLPPPPPPPPPPAGTTVVVNTAVRHQTMTGWQANEQAGHYEPGWQQWRNEVLDRATADGINRIRVDVRSGWESPRDAFSEWLAGLISNSEWRCRRYATDNDNTNPGVIDMSRFSFGELDTAMVRVVIPFRQRLQARGEVLGLTMTYVAFTGQSCGGEYHHTDAAEYAEFAVAVMNHLRDRFGVVPDTWEVINEPDNTGGIWSVARIEAALIALDSRLRQAGYQVAIIAPSHSSATQALTFAQTLLASSAASVIDQIGYHRYDGPSEATVRALGDAAKARGISTAMTEHIGSGIDNLITDLTLGQASSWEQFSLAFPGTDNGAHYYTIVGTAVETGSLTKYLRHYFRHVRRGAVRVDATSTSSDIVPVAFRNTNGRVTVVMKYNSAGTYTVGGLPPGRYGIGFESEAASDGTLPDVTVGSDGVATLTLQSRGVVVLYGRSG